jgi:hypothetical protein
MRMDRASWAALAGDHDLTIVRANWDTFTGDVIACVWADDDHDEMANARLIAAAPELYAACELAIPNEVCLTNRNIPDGLKVALDCTMGDLRKIAAALAKARGETL